MLCCTDCFADSYINNYIRKYGQSIANECSFCGSEEERFGIEPDELGDIFFPVVNHHYCNLDKLTQFNYTDPLSEGEKLSNLLQEDFPVFSEYIGSSQGLIEEILTHHSYSQNNVDSCDFSDFMYRREIDSTNRFPSDYVTTLRLSTNKFGHSFSPINPPTIGEGQETEEAYLAVSSFLEKCVHELPKGSSFWRARLGKSHKGENIGAPPPELTKAGRANVTGQRVLYLASSEEVALAEVRPSIGEEISLGEFSTSREVKVCCLIPKEEQPSVFQDLEYFIAWEERQKTRRELGHEFGRPILPSDEAKDYIFTQFLSGMLRKLGFDGIAYPSSQAKEQGVNYNYMFFDPEIAAPTGKYSEKKVKTITYDVT